MSRLETSTDLAAGRPGFDATAALRLEDFQRVAAAIGRTTRANMRLDAAAGLTRNLFALRASAEAAGAAARVALSCFAAGDLTVVKEGVARFDPRLLPLILKCCVVAADGTRGLDFLSEWGDVILATGRPPLDVYRELAADLAQHGIQVGGNVAAMDETAATDFSLMAELFGFAGRLPERLFEPFGFFGVEFLPAAVRKQGDLPSLDDFRDIAISSVRMHPATYSRRLARPVGPRRALVRRYKSALLIVSAREGWRMSREESPRGAACENWSVVDTAQAVAAIESFGNDAAATVVCVPEHFRVFEPAPSPQPGMLRSLPAPFDRYFAISSDVDWSTPAKLWDQWNHLALQLGLPCAFSFFLQSANPAWIAAYDEMDQRRKPDNSTGMSLEAWASKGALDTFHHLTFTMLQVPLVRPVEGEEFRPASATPAAWGRGFIVSAGQLCVSLEFRAGGHEPAHLQATVVPEVADCAGKRQSFVPLPPWAADCETLDWSVVVPANVEDVKITMIDFDLSAIAFKLAALAARGICPVVYVPHGSNVRDVANLRSDARSRLDGNTAVLDMDEPGSVFRMVEPLRAVGLRAVGRYGEVFGRELAANAKLLKPQALRDGRQMYTLARCQARPPQDFGFSDRWLHDKGVQHAAGLGYVIGDILQRAAWSGEGAGGILYTHLGHTQFDMTSSRQPWPAEAFAIFERLATRFHPDGEDEAPYRLFMGTSAAVVMHSAVRRGLQSQLRQLGDDIEIGTWRDEALDAELPDIRRFGSSLLHNQTIFVANAAHATVTSAGEPIASLARMRGGGGPDYVTIVDDSAPAPLLLGCPRRFRGQHVRRTVAETPAKWADDSVILEPEAPGAEAVFDLWGEDLGNRDAWSVELRSDGEFDLAIMDTRGEWYAAGSGAGASWEFMAGIPADAQGWRRHVFRFADRASHPAGPPKAGILGFRVRWAVSSQAALHLRCLALLGPRASFLPPPPVHWLGGRVLDTAGCPPPAEAQIVLVGDGAGASATIDGQGRYEVEGLERNRLYKVTLLCEDRTALALKGPVFAATRNRWDWDFTVSS